MDVPQPDHVLAINDDRELLRLYAELLSDEGYRVSVDVLPATDLADVRALAPDLVVLDLVVGDQDRGTAFLELLRGDPTTRDLPVVVCSADSERLGQLEGWLLGLSSSVLRKPFDIDELLAAVRAGLACDVPIARSAD